MALKTNEALGMTAEKVICDLSGLDSSALANRIDTEYVYKLQEPCRRVVRELPAIADWVGSVAGIRGGHSKSAVDFRTIDGRSISVKTNIKGSDKVCPPEVGQPSRATFERYFGHLSKSPVDIPEFKRMAMSQFPQMLAIYVKHLLDCDFLAWIGEQRDGSIRTLVIPRQEIAGVNWSAFEYSYSRTLEEWNESNTVRFLDGGAPTTLGEFQAHQHRGSYKFRLKLLSLMRMLELSRAL